MIERSRRLLETARALRAAKALESHEKWDAERLAAHQRRRLLAIVRNAAAHSPFYRERFAGVELSDDLDPAELPSLDKATMLERFDELVTDRRLTLAGVERHLEEVERAGGDPRLFGEYRAMASGGSSGRRGVFVYSRAEWTEILAGSLRVTNGYLGLAPRLPRRRLASIMAGSPLHMTGRMMASMDVGAQRMLRLDARAPLEELVEALNAFRPESLSAYASVAAQLAERQLAGELRIALRVAMTTSEVRSDEVLELPAAGGGIVKVHPLAIRSPLAGIGALREYRVICDHNTLRVQSVLAASEPGDGEAIAQIRDRLHAALAERGAKPPAIEVEPVDRIPRDPRSGKRKLIEAARGDTREP